MSKTGDEATLKQVTDLLEQMAVGTADEKHKVANELASLVKNANNIHFLNTYQILDKIKVDAENMKTPGAREGAMHAFKAIADNVIASDAYLINLLPLVLERHGDKSAEVRKSAEEASSAFVGLVSPHSTKVILPVLFNAIENGVKWQTKFGALDVLKQLIAKAPAQIRLCLPDIMPHIADAMWDTKTDVKKSATDTMFKLCELVDNMDIEKFIPALIQTIANPVEVPDCVYKLASTTFVATVEAPALAIMMPLLVRGLAEPNTAVKRQTAVIIDNMCKLVAEPSEAEFFIPKLKPGLERIIEIGADPELRNVCERAHRTLIKAGGGASAEEELAALKRVSSAEHLLKNLKNIVGAQVPSALEELKDEFFVEMLKYVSELASELVEHKTFEEKEWIHTLSAYLASFLGTASGDLISKIFMEECIANIEAEKALHRHEEHEEGEDLCDCEFSLAYGGMILLNNTRLALKRGKRYGLCGANGTGKTTLMRAISKGQLEGFPSADVLKTVFVEHSLQASQADLPVLQFVHEDAMTKDVPHDEALELLESVGFDKEMQEKAVGALSGGWKMKLELARAIMVKADILLLDEPTNHLDVKNVAWLMGYLKSLTDVTSMIVSHDSKFLDEVCTHIIHYENRKLVKYKGNLTEFIAKKPEAQAYYSISQTQFKFKFPEPGFLDGVNTKDKAILKLVGATYSYPGSEKLQLHKVSLACSLSSRVACLGPNGAGKSTLIKVMTGEVVPNSGEVIKHPNLRIAYVAQHAFHHLNQHLDKTANQYIQWRFQSGEDKELLEKESRQLTDEEKKIMEQKVSIDGEKRQIENIVGRRKLKKSFEYELKFKNMPHEENKWVPRDQLEEWGFQKMVQKYDDKEAALAGAYQRPLTALNVQKHLEDLGLDPEFSTHNFLRGLSGGQKVKVVLGASTWNNPQMLILDEPSNYLDRDSLGALSGALKDFGGAVIVISHSQEFVKETCTEFWHMDAGVLTIEGQSAVKEKVVQKEVEETVDAFGNVIKLKSQKKLSKKEARAKARRKAAARKRGEDVSDDDEEWPEE